MQGPNSARDSITPVLKPVFQIPLSRDQSYIDYHISFDKNRFSPFKLEITSFWINPLMRRLNMELDLQSLFGFLCSAVLIGWDPATPPPRI